MAMQRERRDQLLDRLPRRAVRAALGGDVLRAQPCRFETITSTGPSPHRIPSRDALGRETTRRRWRSPKARCPPSPAPHAAPAGTRREVAKTTVNHLYSVVSGKARVKIEGGADETLAVGDVIAVRAGTRMRSSRRDAIVVSG